MLNLFLSKGFHGDEAIMCVLLAPVVAQGNLCVISTNGWVKEALMVSITNGGGIWHLDS
jgi:hypothetical protein